MTTGRSKKKTIAIWIVSLGLAFAFLGAGGMKLAGAEPLVQNFAKWGLPDWLRYVTGFVEVVAALLLIAPKTRFFGAALILPTMVGAVWIHLAFAEYAGLGAPLILFALAAIVGYTYRETAYRLLHLGQFAEEKVAVK